MAQELDPQQLQCDNEDGRLAAAFAHWYYPGPRAVGAEWAALCPSCLDEHAGTDDLFYVRFRDDPAAPNDTVDHGDDDPALKYGAGGADNNNS